MALPQEALVQGMHGFSASGLEAEYFEINKNERKVAKALNAVAKVPGLKEYFTFSIHSVWRRPEPASARPSR